MSDIRNENLLFLHGWGVTRGVWNGFEKRLCGNRSFWNPCLYTLAQNGCDASLESLAEQIKKGLVSKTIVVAWSIGGLIAITLSGLCDKVKAIIFIASAPCFINKPGWSYTIVKARFEKLHDLLKSRPEAALSSFSDIVIHGDPSPEETLKKLQNNMATQTDREVLSPWLDDLVRLDLRSAYARLSVPAYVLLGQNDVLVKNAVREQLIRLNGNIKVDMVNDSGHAPFISREEDTLRLIQGYINAEFGG